MTSGSRFPYKRWSSPRRNRMETPITNSEMIPVTIKSWTADSHARFLFFCPIYWEATTAPPVATAANTLIKSVLIISTSDTPEVAASPTLETIIVSTIPTVTARILVNKGMEFTLSSQNFKGNFQWNTDFNISFNRNKLTKLGLNKVYYYACLLYTSRCV